MSNWEKDNLARTTQELEFYGESVMNALDSMFSNSQNRNKSSTNNWEEFQDACIKGDLTMAKSCIKKMNERQRGEALYFACIYQRAEIAQILLSQTRQSLTICRPSGTFAMKKNPYWVNTLVNTLSKIDALDCKSLILSDLKLDDPKLDTLVKFGLPLFPYLELLDLSSNRITDAGAEVLANFLILNSTITSVKLENNMIGNEGALFFKQALSQNQVISHFDLTANPTELIDEVTVEVDANSLFQDVYAVNLGQSYEIDLVNKKFSPPLAAVLLDHLDGAKLDRLSFYGCTGLSGNLFLTLMRALEKCVYLSTLDFTCCGMGDQSFTSLCGWVGAGGHLEKLKAAENGITDAGAKALARSVLSAQSALVEIDLEHNKITTEGVTAIAKAIKAKGAQKLKFLFLGYNLFNQEGITQLSSLTTQMNIACDQHNIFGSTWFQPTPTKKGQKVTPVTAKRKLKFILVGSPEIGKSALFTQFAQNHFVENSGPSQVEQSRTKQVVVDQEPVTIELCDVDLEHFLDLTEYYLNDISGIIFAYSITSKESFTTAAWLFDQLSKGIVNTPRILIGLKCDLEAKRKVLIRDGLEIATQKIKGPFFEVSARINYNVQDSFAQLVRECWKKTNPKRASLALPLSGSESKLAVVEKETKQDKKARRETIKKEKKEKEKEKEKEKKATPEKSTAKLPSLTSQEKLKLALEEASVEVYQTFSSGFNEHVQKLSTANILVVGPTGAGKSTIINTIFGNVLDPSNSVVTKEFCLYEKEGKPLRIWDSKGVETGVCQSIEFQQKTKDFLINDPRGREIHLIWYVINSSSLRIQQSDKEFCELFQRESGETIPVIFLLNHSDQINEQQKQALLENVKKMQIKNTVEILHTYGIPPEKVHIENVDQCNICKAEGFIRKGVFYCDSGHQRPVIPDNGLDKLINTTLQYFPQSAKQCFMQSQIHSIMLKKETGKQVILNFMEKIYIENNSFSMRKRDSVWKRIGDMMAQISVIFGFPLDRAKDDLENIFREGFSASLKTSFSLFSRNQSSPALFGALGILWAGRLEDIANRALNSTSREDVAWYVGKFSASFLFAQETVALVLKALSLPMEGNSSKCEKMIALYNAIDELITNSPEMNANSTIGSTIGSVVQEPEDPAKVQLRIMEDALDKVLKDKSKTADFFDTFGTKFPLLERHNIFLSLCSRLVKTTRTTDRGSQKAIFGMASFWIERHYDDFQKSALLHGYLTNFLSYSKSIDFEAVTALEQSLKMHGVASMPPSPSSRVTRESGFLESMMPPQQPFFLQFEARLIAQVLTQEDHAAFKEIPIRAFSFNASKEGLTAFINYFNKTTTFVETLVLQEKKLETRAKVLGHVIAVTQELATLNNFHGVLACFSALTNSAIHRLKKTWAALTPDARKTYKQILELTTLSSGTYSNIWNKTQRIPPDAPCVPHVGSYLSYVLKAMESIRTSVSDPDAQARKQKMLEVTVAEDIERFQNTAFPPIKLSEPSEQSLLDFVRRMPCIENESKRYEISVSLESRSTKTPQKQEPLYWSHNLLSPNPSSPRSLTQPKTTHTVVNNNNNNDDNSSVRSSVKLADPTAATKPNDKIYGSASLLRSSSQSGSSPLSSPTAKTASPQTKADLIYGSSSLLKQKSEAQQQTHQQEVQQQQPSNISKQPNRSADPTYASTSLLKTSTAAAQPQESPYAATNLLKTSNEQAKQLHPASNESPYAATNLLKSSAPITTPSNAKSSQEPLYGSSSLFKSATSPTQYSSPEPHYISTGILKPNRPASPTHGQAPIYESTGLIRGSSLPPPIDDQQQERMLTETIEAVELPPPIFAATAESPYASVGALKKSNDSEKRTAQTNNMYTGVGLLKETTTANPSPSGAIPVPTTSPSAKPELKPEFNKTYDTVGTLMRKAESGQREPAATLFANQTSYQTVNTLDSLNNQANAPSYSYMTSVKDQQPALNKSEEVATSPKSNLSQILSAVNGPSAARPVSLNLRASGPTPPVTSKKDYTQVQQLNLTNEKAKKESSATTSSSPKRNSLNQNYQGSFFDTSEFDPSKSEPVKDSAPPPQKKKGGLFGSKNSDDKKEKKEKKKKKSFF